MPATPDLNALNALPDFTLTGTRHNYGRPRVDLHNENGVNLTLTEDGVQALGSQPEFAATVQLVGKHIVNRQGFIITSEQDRLDLGVTDMRMAEHTERTGRQSSAMLAADGETYIKTFADDQSGRGPLQLDTMDLLHGRLIQNSRPDDIVNVPKQYGLLTWPPTANNTLLMERVEGTSLRKLSRQADARGRLPELAHTELRERLGLLAALVNDTKGHDNFIVEGNPDNPTALHVIDQPNAKFRTSIVKARGLLRLLAGKP